MSDTWIRLAALATWAAWCLPAHEAVSARHGLHERLANNRLRIVRNIDAGREVGVRTSAQRVSFGLAVTIDDLPWTAAGSAHPDVVMEGTRRMLDALASRRVSATGFIVCDAMAARPGQVERWARAGHSLGNHTQSHPDLNRTPPDRWLDEVRQCDATIRTTGTSPRYFRYPMLHRGTDAQVRAAVANGLHALGYVVAPVTIDNSEWILAAAYERAAQTEDSTAMRQIADLYVAHILRATSNARAVSRMRFDRDVDQVLLLHANRLNADWLAVLLDSLSAGGARFVPLDSALRDPVYALPDGYIGPRGLSWLYRVAPARTDLAAWDEAEELRLLRALERIGSSVEPDVAVDVDRFRHGDRRAPRRWRGGRLAR